MKKLFDTQSHSWREAGLARQLSVRAVKRARIQAIVMVPLLVGILVVYGYRDDLFGPRVRDAGADRDRRSCSSSWAGRSRATSGRALGPTLFRRLDPGTAGTVGLPHPPGLRRAGHHRRAARRRARPAHAGRRRRLHRGHRRSRGAADARQPHRRHRAAQRAARSGWASACACRAAASPGRSRGSSARWACSTRPSRRATTT